MTKPPRELADTIELHLQYLDDYRGTIGASGGRFDDDDRPTLNWILFHVLQEYARHAGHLDVVRELTDGVTGE